MVREVDPDQFKRRLEERRAQKASFSPPLAPPAPPIPNTWQTEDLLPDLGLNLSEADKELDALVDSIDIIAAYNKFCGKMVPDVGGKREGIKISCPNPAHPDKDPSAWINLDKQTYFCGGCQEGGDAHDIAAYNLGYPVPGYKDGETFHKLRLQMGEAFGYRVKKVAGGEVSWIEPQSETAPTGQAEVSENPEPTSSPGPQSADVADSSNTQVSEPDTAPDNVEHMWADNEPEELVVYPYIDWKKIVPKETFLRDYMEACTNDDAPEEYHFWHGLMALGLVVGRNVTLDDTQPVYGNMLLCILGATGSGKSRSRRHLNAVLRESAPYHEDGTRTTGVKIVPTPGSGESLVHQFNYEGKDPSNNNRSLGPQRVTGIVDFDEMSALLARANRQGSTVKSSIMQMADASNEVSISSMTRGTYVAHEPFCSITASTQPKAVRNIMSKDDQSSGFLNRWVFAGGMSKQTEALGGVRSGIRVDLTDAIARLKTVRSWGAIERSIEMDDDAYDAYVAFFRSRIEQAKSKDDTDLLKRIDLIAKKLMLLLTINLKSTHVNIATVRAMMELFDYVIECYGILNANLGITQMQDVMNEIERVIIKHFEKTKRGATARDIARYTARKNYNLEQIKRALEVMTSLDVIELEPKKPGPGRPSVRYLAVR